jgi:small-conductance mechanosensitive channel
MTEFLKTELITTGNFTITIGNIINALIIFIITYVLIRILSLLITRSFKRKSKPDGRQFSIIQLLKYFLWTLALVFMLQALGLNITFIVASSAALLVGIGLGLQNVFKDFISGIALLIEGTIKVDDIVEVDGLVVRVKEISIRTSKVFTREDNVVIIPNHKFIENNIVNWTNNLLPTRFIINVGVDYSSDIRLVEKLLIECALENKDVLHDKDFYPSVRFSDFGNSSLDFQLFFYSFKLFRIENVKSQLRFQILEAFRKNHVTIPFPQRVLHYTDK